MVWSITQYDNILTGLFGSSGWFRIHLALVRELGLGESVFLHYLINHRERIKGSDKYKWNDGWFFCSPKLAQEELGITYQKQYRLAKELVKSGVLEMEKRGFPAKRYFRIEAQKVLEIVESSSSPVKTDSTGRQLVKFDRTSDVKTDSTDLLIRINTNSRPASTGRLASGLLLSDEQLDQHASHLLSILTRYGKDSLKVTTRSKGVIRKPITLSMIRPRLSAICLEDAVSSERMKQVLDWLEENYNDQYTAKIRKMEDIELKWESWQQQACGGENGESHSRSDEVNRVRLWLASECDWEPGDILQEEDVRLALESLGLEHLKVSADEI